MLLVWRPRHRGISTELFAKFIMNQSQCIWDIVTQVVESFDWKIVLSRPVDKFSPFNDTPLKMRFNGSQCIQYFASKLSSSTPSNTRHYGRDGKIFIFFRILLLRIMQILWITSHTVLRTNNLAVNRIRVSSFITSCRVNGWLVHFLAP